MLYCGPCGTAMSHKWTVNKKQQYYRYYVCTTAEKRGWDSCPTKSLPAPAIESFVVERIRCIGEDPSLVAETLHQARAQNKKRVDELESEKKLLEGELKQLDAQVRKLIGGMTPDGNNPPQTTAKLADLQDRIRLNEQRATNTRARITQIMDLLLLAPDIQEDILLLPRTVGGHDSINEHKLRVITGTPFWSKQRMMWKKRGDQPATDKTSNLMLK